MLHAPEIVHLRLPVGAAQGIVHRRRAHLAHRVRRARAQAAPCVVLPLLRLHPDGGDGGEGEGAEGDGDGDGGAGEARRGGAGECGEEGLAEVWEGGVGEKHVGEGEWEGRWEEVRWWCLGNILGMLWPGLGGLVFRVLLREPGRDGIADGQMLHIARTFTMVGNYDLSAQTA